MDLGLLPLITYTSVYTCCQAGPWGTSSCGQCMVYGMGLRSQTGAMLNLSKQGTTISLTRLLERKRDPDWQYVAHSEAT